MVKVKNILDKRLVIPSVRERNGQMLSFAPSECKQLLSATVNHPAVSVYIGRGLQLLEEKVLDPPAPVLDSPAPQPVPEVAPETPVEMHAVSYSSAPGVTEDNEATLLERFPQVEDLANASRSDLEDFGFTRSAAKKLIAWAADQR